jgi:hypothetical protein
VSVTRRPSRDLDPLGWVDDAGRKIPHGAATVAYVPIPYAWLTQWVLTNGMGRQRDSLSSNTSRLGTGQSATG